MTTTTKKKQQPDFHLLAGAYIDDHIKTAAVYHQGRLYTYTGTHYVEETELAPKVRRFLIKNQFPHNNHIVSNVVKDIEALTFQDSNQYPTMPFYVAGGFPKNIIAFQNGLLDVNAYLSGNAELIPHTPKWVSTFCLDRKSVV